MTCFVLFYLMKENRITHLFYLFMLSLCGSFLLLLVFWSLLLLGFCLGKLFLIRNFISLLPYLFWLMFDGIVFGIVIIILDICLLGMPDHFIMFLFLVFVWFLVWLQTWHRFSAFSSQDWPCILCIRMCFNPCSCLFTIFGVVNLALYRLIRSLLPLLNLYSCSYLYFVFSI